MTSRECRPTLEVKAAALAASRPDTSRGMCDLTADPAGTVWAIAAVTGVTDDVGDVITAGAVARTRRERPDVTGVSTCGVIRTHT
jgi:hypothetical protein